MKTYKVSKTKVVFKHTEYSDNDNLAIICEKVNGDLYDVLTVNIPGLALKTNEIVLPTYKLSANLLNLFRNTFINKTIKTIPIGLGHGEIVLLKEDWKTLI